MKRTENHKLLSSLGPDTEIWESTFLPDPGLKSFASLQELQVNTHEANQSVNPFKKVCLLEITDKNGVEYTASGFFISPRCVITAGHCIHINGNFASKATVIPGGNRRIFGSMSSNHFQTVNGWAIQRNRNFDFGAIILRDNSLYNQIGSRFGYEVYNDPGPALISGFPESNHGEQWMSQGQVLTKSAHRFYHNMPTGRGSSGSPLLIDDGLGERVIGLHVFADKNGAFALRITPAMFQSWKEWSEL